MENPYLTLGVAKTASPEEIKKAYRRLARQYHPDRNPDDKTAEDKFKEVQAAYDLLSDEDKRAAFDAHGNAKAAAAGAGPQPEGFGGPDGFDINDILNGMFGGGKFRGTAGFGHMPRDGADVETHLQVSFDDTLNDCVRHFSLEYPDGVRKHTVKVPAGAKDGMKLKLKGKGKPGANGGSPGDLYVVVNVAPSSRYERHGEDLLIDVPVAYWEAALGGEVAVPTPWGKQVALKISAGTQDGKLLRIRGQGTPKLKGEGRGDLIARLKIAIPDKLTDKERKALEDARKHSTFNPRERAFK